jgi:hypothetical protein
MFRLRIESRRKLRRKLRRKFLPLFFPLVLASCGFADLRPIGIEIFPARAYTVLPSESSPLSLRFDTEMMKNETEAALQVSYYGGFAEGDLRWEGRTLYFVPAPAWKPGVRYVLKLSGTVYSQDGRELLLSEVIPFFAVAPASVPYLQGVAPQDGASAAAFAPGETVLEFTFSLPMDRRATEAAFAFDGSGPWYAEWLDDDRALKIRCENPLAPWTVYRWSLGEGALSRTGAPLAAGVSGSFITDDDRIRPRPLKIIPLLKGEEEKAGIWRSWIPAGLDLENGLWPGQGIGIEFDKPMDGESLRRSLSFTPSLPGRTEDLSPVSAVFIPDRNPDPGVVYTMTISGDVLDGRGLKMGDDYVFFFEADIPFLTVASLNIEREDEIDEIETPARGGASPAFIDVPGGGVLRFTVVFPLPFTSDAQSAETFRISLDPFFPATLPPVSLRFARWLSSDRVRMEWEGLEAGTEEEPRYYRLSLPGGRNGINNGHGSYPEENFYFYFKVFKAEEE